MKTLLFIFVLVPMMAQAQLGVHAGMTHSYWSNYTISVDQSDPGIFAFGGISYTMRDFAIPFRAELNYNGRSIAYSGTIEDSEFSAKELFHSLELPLLFLIEGSWMDYFIGPSFNYTVALSQEITLGDQATNQTFTDDIDNFDYGLIMGIGRDIGPIGIHARWRFTYSRFSDNSYMNYGQLAISYSMF